MSFIVDQNTFPAGITTSSTQKNKTNKQPYKSQQCGVSLNQMYHSFGFAITVYNSSGLASIETKGRS